MGLLKRGVHKWLVRKNNAYGNSSLNYFHLPLPKPNVTSLKDLLIPIERVLKLVEKVCYASLLTIWVGGKIE